MLDTSDDLQEATMEIGCPVEQLLTPLTRFLPQQAKAHFAIDNGAFSRFNRSGFLSLLDREYPRRELCRFVAVPDVVANARRTLEAFNIWEEELGQWPLALVAQDGQEDLPIPWRSLAAVFIGGSTEWKLSKAAADVIKTAQLLGKWIHVGRVNTPGRFEYFEKLGADSIDGSGLARYSWMRERIYRAQHEPKLFEVT